MIKQLISSCILLALLPGICSAFTDHQNIPESPGSQLIEPFIEMLNAQDQSNKSEFIDKHYHPEFIEVAPMNVHLDVLNRFQRDNGKFTFKAVRQYDDARPETQYTVIGFSERLETWSALVLDVDAQDPSKLRSIQFFPARPPSFIELKGLNEKSLSKELDAYVKRMDKKDIFSGTVLLAKGDRSVYESATGYASKRFKVENNIETKFNLGSMNKMFTAVAIMQLVERDKLKLSDTLDQFVDESWLSREVSSKIQIRHLLTHSSGLGNYFNDRFMESSKRNFRQLSDYKSLVNDEQLQFEPGARWSYSNTGMLMLGVVIEKVSGESYFDFVKANIFLPAGMTNTDSYEMDQPVENLAIGYEPADNETGWINNLYLHVLKGGPAGGGFSTVKDLHKFALALTQYKLLSEQSTAQLLTPSTVNGTPGYGFGFGIGGAPNDRIVGHNGGFPGISSNLDIYLDSEYVAVVLSNYSEGSRPIERKIRELISRLEHS